MDRFRRTIISWVVNNTNNRVEYLWIDQSICLSEQVPVDEKYLNPQWSKSFFINRLSGFSYSSPTRLSFHQSVIIGLLFEQILVFLVQKISSKLSNVYKIFEIFNIIDYQIEANFIWLYNEGNFPPLRYEIWFSTLLSLFVASSTILFDSELEIT